MIARQLQRARLRNAYLISGGLLLALYLFVPPFQGSAVVFSSLSGSSAVAILVGVRRNRPSAPWPWLLFALAQMLFFLGDMYTYLYPELIGHDVPFPSIGDVFYLAQYPLLMLGIILIVRRRNPHGDRAGVIDALILTVGVGLLSFVFLMAPYIDDATLGALAKSVSVAYPIGDVLLVAAVLRLVFDGGRRPSSFSLLIAASATLFATDAAYGYALLNGTFHHQLIYDVGWIGFYLLWGATALDPSMPVLTESSPDRERRLTSRRLALLSVASVMAPALEIVREARSANADLLVLSAASMVLFILVILRVVGLARQHERAVSRERALGDAAVALVGAVSEDEVRVVALEAAEALMGDAGEVRACTGTPAGLTLIGPGGDVPLSEDTAAQLGAAIGLSLGGPLDAGARDELGVSQLAVRITVFPVITPTKRGMLLVASSAPLSPLIAVALRSLMASVALARGAAAAIEEAHRQQGEARFGSLVRNASDLITVVDLEGCIDYQSPSIDRILGYSAEDVLGSPFADLLAPGDRGRLAQVLASRTQGGAETHTFDCVLAHADGRSIDFEVLATDLVDDEHVRGIVLNGRDISERKAFEAQIAHQAFHDPVTGLPNRALFSDRVQHALTRADRGHEAVGVIFLDVDDFKTINDSLGHPVGDEVLREVGRRIAGVIRPTDTAARFGGDEFAVLVEGVPGSEAIADTAAGIVAAFVAPVRLAAAQDIVVRPSLGIAVAVPDAAVRAISADDLVRNADAAMYICKRDGKGGYRVFEEEMHERVLERLTLRGELQRAIEANQLELYFQPLVELQSGDACGVEALCRWNHPTRGFVQPDQFIPLAEETGLIVEIGRWVLQEGCRHALDFQAAAAGDSPLRLGVNLSVRQLQHPDIVSDVRRALVGSGLDPSTLVLEVTESVMMADAQLAATRLHELRELGARVALDDFGTGYSSLSHLSRFPIDVLKMDRSFLAPEGALAASGLAAAIVSLGVTLGLEVVAEGIERPGQMAALRELGCPIGQGYLIGRPMNADAMLRWLRERRPAATRHLRLVA